MHTDSIARTLQRARQAWARKPALARHQDLPARATLMEGLRTRVELPGGGELLTDLGPALGGEGAGLPPGWLMRAGLASCLASAIALRAAELGLRLNRLEVVAGSESDARGLLEHEPPVQSAPLQVSLTVRLEAGGTDAATLRALVDWADSHSPVSDALRRTIDLRLEVHADAS